jgi:diguanylate cyclase (GGDEF)-like protein
MTTTTPMEDVALGSALATLWQRHRQTNLDRIALLERTTADVIRSTAGEAAIAEGASTAHKLAGSLGTFGFDAGSRAALEAESLLREPTIDGRLLAEAVRALRSSVEVASKPSESQPEDGETVGKADPQVVAPARSAVIHITSADPDLITRLTVEATAIDLAIASTSMMPSIQSLRNDPPAALIIDDPVGRTWTRSSAATVLAELAQHTLIVVLTEGDTFADRVEAVKAGATGVVPRSQNARETMAFIGESLALRTTPHAQVLALNLSAGLLGVLKDAVAKPNWRLDVQSDPAKFWDTLEEQGADLVVVGFAGPQLSGPEVCRVIRSHPRWHHLPLIVVGERDPIRLDMVMSAGADDYVNAELSAHDLRARLTKHLERKVLSQARSDTDPLTGAENRAATERSLDRLLRLATRRHESFAVGLIAVDRFDHICESEGTAMGDVILRRLGATLMGSFRGEDIVGRWSHDGFSVGMFGATREVATHRIEGVLNALTAEGFATTSGGRVHYKFSAGVVASPADGSSLSSLERLGETALGRAKASTDPVVTSGAPSADQSLHTTDVVLVEDDDSVADVIEHAVRLRDYGFVRFTDGAEAARVLGEGQVKGRVVLLDVGLPSLDGFGVLQVLRSQGVLADTRVIMLTARSTETEMLRALGLGATEHITKPFSVPILLGRLAQTLAGVSS